MALAAESGVRVAIEVIPNALSSPDALVQLIEDELESLDVGICLDYGHANLMGDLGDAIETVSGHLWTTHVHDNRGREDDHLVPFMGTIDWGSRHDGDAEDRLRRRADARSGQQRRPGGDPEAVGSGEEAGGMFVTF